MYKNHFGFTEKPFQLVPNPAYLFLSKSHEEALAHLNYAIAQGDGFVEITGEVGTGKTTLCRAFVESLNDGTETAYIFNPRLNANELLEAIHDEFGIRYAAGGSTKALVDSLNGFLLEKKAQGKKILLIIDEAQNLSKEVLEQVRLLSNLETSTEKLLQIVLVGQPELADMLNSYELRQLGQRITLSAFLTPLSFADTGRYIQHRLHIAARGVDVPFTHGAVRKIYRYSGGIPRMIHVVSDRALLVAYVLGRNEVTGAIVRTAIRELAGRENAKKNVFLIGRIPLITAVLLGVGVLGAFGMREWDIRFSSPDHPPISAVKEAPVSTRPSAPPVVPRADSSSGLWEELLYTDRVEAVSAVFSLWRQTAQIPADITAIRNDPAFFQSAAENNGFELYRVEGDLALLPKLNLPAILTCYVPGKESLQYLLLSGMDGGKLVFSTALSAPGKSMALSEPEVAARWSGVAYIPWKNFLGFRGTIPLAASRQSLLMLKGLLKEIGFNDMTPGPEYDEGTRLAVKEIQKKYGIEVDGLVGSLTKILLYNEQGSFNMPHLMMKD
ncbi:MAG: AAA family ATPase [Desulfobacterales bacterium]|jgi:general secretion pathway protein A|nr:AAA family ATPase [Desulfobacterales bacterium]